MACGWRILRASSQRLGEREPAIRCRIRRRRSESKHPTRKDLRPSGLGSREATYFRYEHAAFGFYGGELLWIDVAEPGAATERGVGIGDALETVRRAYPEVECSVLNEGEVREFDACAGQILAQRYLWFGGDPATAIAIAMVPLEGF